MYVAYIYSEFYKVVMRNLNICKKNKNKKTHSSCWKITFAHSLIEDIHTVFKSRYTMTHITAMGVDAYWSIWIATVLASFTIVQIYHVQQRNKFTLDIAWCTQIPLPLQFNKLTYATATIWQYVSRLTFAVKVSLPVQAIFTIWMTIVCLFHTFISICY